jgi:hypothetical protein
MEVLILEDRIPKRYYLLSNLDSLIQESVYYRSFSDDMKSDKKVLYIYEEESGKIEIQ